jgi:uncharacterized protein (DUF3820 family)
MVLYSRGKVTNKSTMPFGKHKGKMLRDVPADCLGWLADQPEVKYKHSTILVYVESRRSGSGA